MVRCFEELSAARRIVDCWYENTMLQITDHGFLEALCQHFSQPLRAMLSGQPESQKPPWNAATTKDATPFVFKQCFELGGWNFCCQPQSQHPSCRCAAN